MRKSYKIILSLIIISVPLVIGFTFMNATEEPFLLLDYEPLDIGPRLRTIEYPRGNDFKSIDTKNLKAAQDGYYQVGDILEWYISDDVTAEVLFDDFELRAIGNTAEIWVQVDMSYPDGRETPIITDEEVVYMLDQFENNILPTDTDYFGNPEFHDGSESQLEENGIVPDGTYYEENGRNVILVSNIRDEMYYSRSYPYYVVGFYWSLFEREFDRNIISIDSHDWENRLGPDVSRPYLYESVVAHEYQHLIHDDYNPMDDLFMNEGCSMYAEPLCGYPIDWGSINSFLYTPDNSLTEWGDQGDINILADYGQALLWSIYLSDHYGGAEFLSYFVQTGIPGIEGINNALNHFGYIDTSFEDIFYDWTIANLIHTNQIGDGKFTYNSIDLGCPEAIEARTYDVKKPWSPPTTGSDFGQTKTDLHKNTGYYMVNSFGSDYIKLSGLKESMSSEFIFDGDDVANPPRWTKIDQDADGDLEWYSTSAKPEVDLSLKAVVNVPEGETAILTFETYYDIELLWDYGFVQVSTDNGDTWVSLSNEYTTLDHDPEAYPDIIDNLPGLTGQSGGWINMNFDLSSYQGQEILLNFRYMTDWGTENPGWWIDNIKINDQVIDDADDLVIFTQPSRPETDFILSFIDVSLYNENPIYNDILELPLDPLYETGSLDLTNYIDEEGYLLVIITPKLGPADYTYEITRI